MSSTGPLRGYRCPVCDLTVTARAAVDVAHPCPKNRTEAGQPRMTAMTPDPIGAKK